MSHLLSTRLSYLYGKSGSGKTSLLCAGLIPWLSENGYLPVYVRCAPNSEANPIELIIEGLIEASLKESKKKSQNHKLHDIKELRFLSLKELIDKLWEYNRKPFVVFIDQFEEIFLSIGDKTRSEFEGQVSECIRPKSMDAFFVLSLREDYTPELNDLRLLKQNTHLFYRLKSLSKEAAREAIVLPAQVFGVTYAEGLVEQLITELEVGGFVEPAQLQIVCDSLFNKRQVTDPLITSELYCDLGGTRRILADFVDDVLQPLHADDRELAKQVLCSMVTSQFTRTSKSIDDLYLLLKDNLKEERLSFQELVAYLVNHRLIQRITEVRVESYELSHEYLIGKIKDWIKFEEIQIKRAEDLLRQQWNNWVNHKLSMSQAAFEIINPLREKIFPLSDGLKSLMIRASVEYSVDIPYWLTKNKQNLSACSTVEDLLIEKDEGVKRRALVVLALLDTD